MPDPTPPARPVRRPIPVRVASTERLTPRMLRIVLEGDALDGFPVGEHTDHYVKLLLPAPGADHGPLFDPEEIRATRPRELWPRTRSYTVRAFDPARRRLTLDVVVHGDQGVAGPWALAARPGDDVQILGPGGGYAPDPAAAWHLMVGDPCVVPAIAASLERLPVGATAHVLIEVEDADDEVPLPSGDGIHVRWLHRGAHPDDALLVGALRELEFPDGPVHAFVHGEASAVRAVRRHLIVDRGMPREALSASGYWKWTRTDEAWRAEKPEWNRLAEQDVAGVDA
ncbi:MAG: siderophore-interacting protein [Solirubrobacteraceae bacterium]|nr:siderophore-interacting protein [Solirubrobacteraceae bacterium]